MKHKGGFLLAALLLAGNTSAVVAQNGQEFKEPAGQYNLMLIGDWKAVSYNDAVGRPKTDLLQTKLKLTAANTSAPKRWSGATSWVSRV